MLTITILVIAVVVAVAVRVDGIARPPENFSPAATIRQYHSYLLAQSYYLRSLDHVPPWRVRNARAIEATETPIEPPILEHVTAISYRAIGGERLWLPRAFSVLFWLIGAGLLFAIAARLTSSAGGVVAMVTFLFLPFAAHESRAFQPDPLMVMLMLAALGAILVDHQHQTAPTLVLAGLLTASASLVKPGVALFFCLPVFAALTLVRTGLRGVLGRRCLDFLALAVLPTLAYYIYATRVHHFLSGHFSDKVRPALLGTSTFYRGWASQIGTVLHVSFVPGLLLFAISVATAALVRRPPELRAILWGLLAGYAAFGLTFTEHIHTHDYYSLPLVPIAALALSPLGSAIAPRIERRPPVMRVGLCAVAGVALVAAGWRLHHTITGYDTTTTARVARDVGALTHHTDRGLFLTQSYGLPLEYHGGVVGILWPHRGSQENEALVDAAGLPDGTVRATCRLFRTMRPVPAYFASTDLPELAAQRSLTRFLDHEGVAVAETPTFVVVDLRAACSQG